MLREIAIESHIQAGRKGQCFQARLSRHIKTCQVYLTDEQREELIADYLEWEAGMDVVVGQKLQYNAGLFRVLQAHTTQADWKPTTAQSLFTEVVAPGVIPEWVQPEGAHDAYAEEAQVTHNGHLWKSDISANVWEPGVYGWTDKGEI